MAGASQSVSPRAGVVFDVERADVDGDHFVVRGHWSGVRGMRFMRPTLVVGGRPLLATLEHKPWAPESDPWVAAFPWPGGKADLKTMALAVAPSVTVALVPGGKVPAGKPAAKKPAAAPAPEPAQDGDRRRLDRLQTEVGFLREQIEDLATERDALRAERDALQTDRDAVRTTASDAEAAGRRLERAVTDERRSAETAREEREAAERERRRLQAQRDEAVAAVAQLEGARDEALAQRAEAQAQRDEVLLANEALQRRVNTTLAEDDRERFTHDDGPPRDLGPDEPIGVRSIPAVRTVAPELERTRRRPRGDVSPADLWAIRIFGSVAAVCFITLLAMILRVFL
jgi:hypothetical protein